MGINKHTVQISVSSLQLRRQKGALPKPRMFSGRVFSIVYLFFILNTLVTPSILQRTVVKSHPRFAIQHTVQLYQLMQKNNQAMVQPIAHGAKGWSAHSLLTYLSISLHNNLLPVIGLGLFAIVLYLPQVQNRMMYHFIEYTRMVATLFFFSFAPILLIVNGVVIPFLLASVGFATAIPAYLLGLTAIVNGLIEYAALSLLIMVGLQIWRMTWQKDTQDIRGVRGLDSNSTDSSQVQHRLTNLAKVGVKKWYRSMFSEVSLSQRTRAVLRVAQLSVYRAYGLAVVLFFVAGIVEVYISPTVGNWLLGTP